jgi:hypothetical protein
VKLADKTGWVERTAHVDKALKDAILKTRGVDASPKLVVDGTSTFKLSTYEYDAVGFPRLDHPMMVEAFAAIARTDLLLVSHVEDQEQGARSFFVQPCGMSGSNAGRRANLARRHLHGDPRDDGAARRRHWDRADVLAGWRQPCRVLPALAGVDAARGRNHAAR